MSISLIRLLIQTALSPPNTDQIHRIRQHLSSSSDTEWSSTISELFLHRIAPIVYYTLDKYELTDVVQQATLILLKQNYYQALKLNQLHIRTLDRLLKAMQARQLHPVIWKGIVLADSFYPDLGTRPMADIDFAILPEEKEQFCAVFQALGFIEQLSIETEDAINFIDPIGVACDVHHRVRLFEDKESMNLTIELQTQHLKTPTFSVLEPNAMLVHLVVHLDGHRLETGHFLAWILDIAFVIRRWGVFLDLNRLKTLMPAQEHIVSLFRIIRFLDVEFGEKPPEFLALAAKEVQPLTLEEILRERRLALWGLPSIRGWLRLGASQLGYPLCHNRPTLHLSDLFLCPFDILRNWRMGINRFKKYNY